MVLCLGSRPLVWRAARRAVTVERRALRVRAVVVAAALEAVREEQVHRRDGAFVGRLGAPISWVARNRTSAFGTGTHQGRKLPMMSVAIMPGDHAFTLIPPHFVSLECIVHC